jgi:hypothetical protein
MSLDSNDKWTVRELLVGVSNTYPPTLQGGPKDLFMANSKKNVLVVNVLFWTVAALLHPLANLLPTGSGETPKVFSQLIPMAFLLLAFGSTTMISLP